MEIQFRVLWIYLLLLIRELTIHKSSKYIGVHFDKNKNLWCTSIYANGKRVSLGNYLTEKEAAIARDQAVAYFNLGIDRSNFDLSPVVDPRVIRKDAKERKYHGIKVSIYRGVYWSKREKRWISFIMHNRKNIQLGLFEDEIIAAKTYDKVARYFYGEKAITNFEGTEKKSPEEIHPLTSTFRGVCYNKWKDKWMATIKINYKSKHIGYYDTEILAAKAFNEEAQKYGRKLNLIPEGV